MSAPSTSGLSVELLLRVIDVKLGYFTFTLLYFTLVVMAFNKKQFFGSLDINFLDHMTISLRSRV